MQEFFDSIQTAKTKGREVRVHPEEIHPEGFSAIVKQGKYDP
jgi:hypothetical protein